MVALRGERDPGCGRRTGLFLPACAPGILRWRFAMALGAIALGAIAFECVGTPGDAANREEPMRVTFQTEGGIAHFPGLSQPVTIETDQLPEQEAAELRELMDAARLLDRPAQMGKAARGAADYRQYTITVEAQGRRYTVRLTDPIEDPALQRLLRFLQDQATAERTKARSEDSP
jgi:hypothetical protein